MAMNLQRMERRPCRSRFLTRPSTGSFAASFLGLAFRRVWYSPLTFWTVASQARSAAA